MAEESRSRRRVTRWALVFSGMLVLCAVCAGLLVAWGRGAFESRLMYWRDRGQNCGSVAYAPNGKLLNQDVAEQAITCFVAAHTRCAAAILIRDAPGTDVEDTDTFVVEPHDSGGGCDVGVRFSGGVVGSNRTTTREAQCAGLMSVNGALTINGCQGLGDFTLP